MLLLRLQFAAAAADFSLLIKSVKPFQMNAFTEFLISFFFFGALNFADSLRRKTGIKPVHKNAREITADSFQWKLNFIHQQEKQNN